jgi:hypothetical protein
LDLSLTYKAYINNDDDDTMQKTIICYNENEVIERKESCEDIKNGYKVWIDIVNPTTTEIFDLR